MPWYVSDQAAIRGNSRPPTGTPHRSPCRSTPGIGVDEYTLTKHRHPPAGPLARGVLLGTVEITGCLRDSASQWAEPDYCHTLPQED